ncbi:MAG TPA: hypothetical protein VE197_18625 [Mycobacterium sp.]|nr:hypothetical protein [Mycobacterium sp.]
MSFFGDVSHFFTHTLACSIAHHPFLAVTGGVVALAGLGLAGIGVGVATGLIAEGEGGASILGAMAAEFGATHSGVLIGVSGGAVAAVGGAIAARAGC